MANPAQHFDDSALGEQPPKTGNTADPAWVAGNGTSNTPAKVEKTDGTENIRADATQMGPTHYATPGAGVHTWPSKVQSFNGERI